MENIKAKKKRKEEEFIIERQKFIDEDAEFNKWILSLGFRTGHYWKEGSTYMDINYGWYDKYIDSMYGVELYIHDAVNLRLRFLRDRNEHKFMFIGSGYTVSEVMYMDEAKKVIVDQLKELKTNQLEKLNAIPV